MNAQVISGLTQHIEIRSSHLSNVGELFSKIATAKSVQLTIDAPVACERFDIAMFVASLAREERELIIRFGSRGLTDAIKESLDRCGLRILIWGAEDPHSGELNTSALGALSPAVDEQQRLAKVHPSFFSSTTREEFRSDLARLLRMARMPVPGKSLGAASTIGFEVNSNAEEHGCIIVDTDRPTFRVTLVGYRNELKPQNAPYAAAFLSDYFRAGHSPELPWLELIVVDAGMGLPYPSYRIFQEERGSVLRNLYEEEVAAEQVHLGLVLNKSLSTKGRWGRVLNRQTAAGDGTRLIKHVLGPIRGFAGVRTGRTLARWGYAELDFGPIQRIRQIPYEVSGDALPVFMGTAWQILIPLDAQLTLGF